MNKKKWSDVIAWIFVTALIGVLCWGFYYAGQGDARVETVKTVMNEIAFTGTDDKAFDGPAIINNVTIDRLEIHTAEADIILEGFNSTVDSRVIDALMQSAGY